ncbi:hypothetical protein H4S04_009084 [Coemansia sp. S16]|nr:hypothetical protein H4S04_009084 [Coemansia sp. S16]
MERKDKFNGVLTASLVICAGLFVIIGALSYLTFGEAVEAVILLNLPNDSVWTLSVQFLYSLAIIMSVPLQLFPAIRIIESGIFTQSGKGNPIVKWQKNLFRTLMVGFIAMVAIFGADKLDNFIAIVGASSCLPLSFLYPVMLHYRSLADTWRAKAKDVVLIAIALFGLVYPVPQAQAPAVAAHWHDDPHGQAAVAVSFLVEQHAGASDSVPQHDLGASVGASDLVPQHDFGASAGVAVVPQLAHEQFSHSHLSPHLHVLQLAVGGQVHDVTPSWVQVHDSESHSPPQLH